MKLKTWWIHFKISWLGDKELMEDGKTIPCYKCDKPFLSYPHYGDWGYVYDTHCTKCDKEIMKQLTEQWR